MEKRNLKCIKVSEDIARVNRSNGNVFHITGLICSKDKKLFIYKNEGMYLASTSKIRGAGEPVNDDGQNFRSNSRNGHVNDYISTIMLDKKFQEDGAFVTVFPTNRKEIVAFRLSTKDEVTSGAKHLIKKDTNPTGNITSGRRLRFGKLEWNALTSDDEHYLKVESNSQHKTLTVSGVSDEDAKPYIGHGKAYWAGADKVYVFKKTKQKAIELPWSIMDVLGMRTGSKMVYKRNGNSFTFINEQSFYKNPVLTDEETIECANTADLNEVEFVCV